MEDTDWDTNLVRQLGYGDPDRHVVTIVDDDGDEYDIIPNTCHILAKWPNGACTVHFNVHNSVGEFFFALDEAGDPAAVERLWCCDAEEEDFEHLDTDSPGWIEWPPKQSPVASSILDEKSTRDS